MDYGKQVSASMWLLVFIRTLNAVDLPGNAKAGNKTRKLPSPRTYISIVVAWATLGLMDDAGMGRAAASIGWVLDLTALLLMSTGRSLSTFLGITAALGQPDSPVDAGTSSAPSSPQNVIPQGYA